MGKIARTYGPTDQNAPGYFEEGKTVLSPEVTETDFVAPEKSDETDVTEVSTGPVVIGGELPGPGVSPNVGAETVDTGSAVPDEKPVDETVVEKPAAKTTKTTSK